MAGPRRPGMAPAAQKAPMGRAADRLGLRLAPGSLPGGIASARPPHAYAGASSGTSGSKLPRVAMCSGRGLRPYLGGWSAFSTLL